MDINQAKIYVEYIARMNQSGNIGPVGFNIMARQAQMQEINYLVGQVRDYQPNRSIKPGQPIPPVGAEVTSVVSDMLRTIRGQVVTQNVTNGQVPLPADYLYLSNLESFFVRSQSAPGANDGYQTWVQVDDITEGEFAYRTNSRVKYPDVAAPIATNYGTYFYICPNPGTDPIYSQQIRLTYWQKPPDPIWNFTGTGQNMVYAPTGSHNFSLGEGVHERICWRIIKLYGISTRDRDLITIADNMLDIGV